MLTKSHWDFLNAVSKAIKGQQLTNSGPKGFYIKIILDEGSSQIVDIEGIREMFLAAHKNELCITTSQFFDLVQAGYIINARFQGNYYLVDDKIVADVENYQSPVANSSAFRLPDTSAQFQCDIFMVMPFREELKPVYTDHIKPLIEDMNYSVKRGDDTFSHHDIITEIWSLINNAKLIIADCTGKNANVFYELGLAHAIDKPVIIITQDEEDIPFDIRQRRYIKYDYSTPRGMKQFEEELKKAIQNILGN